MRPPSRASALPLRSALVAVLLAWSLPAAADATLQLFHGPDESTWHTLRSLEARLDGAPLAVPLIGKGHDTARVLVHQPLTAGSHRLEILAQLDGDSKVFTYLGGLRSMMRGVLQLDVQPGDVVDVRTRVIALEGLTLKWEDRYRLSLEATVRRGPRPAETSAEPVTPAPAVAATPPPAPSPAPIPAVAVAARPPPPSCAPSPLRFAFGKADLSKPAEVELDRLSTCLARTTAAIRVDGHADSRGPDAYNEWLGAQRAAAVARFLREHGVAPERITVRSLSAGRPTCTDADAACHARNRRVEITILDERATAAGRPEVAPPR